MLCNYIPLSISGSSSGRLVLFHLNSDDVDLVGPFVSDKNSGRPGHSSVVR